MIGCPGIADVSRIMIRLVALCDREHFAANPKLPAHLLSHKSLLGQGHKKSNHISQR